MKAWGDYSRLLLPTGLQVGVLVAILYGMECIVELQGLKFQNGFLRTIFILGMLAINVLLARRVNKMQFRSQMKKGDIRIKCLFLMAAVVIGGYYMIPIEREVTDGLFAEEAGHEDGHMIYRYYERVNAFLKKDFHWDEKSDIQLLKEQYHQEFVLDPEFSIGDIRRYRSDSLPNCVIEIDRYPSDEGEEPGIIVYSNVEIKTKTGKILIYNPNETLASADIYTKNGEKISGYFIFEDSTIEKEYLNQSEPYLIGMPMENMDSPVIKLDVKVDGGESESIELEFRKLEKK